MPEQVSIVSFDSVDVCDSLYPSVTAVHFPISEMALAAVRALMQQLSGEPVPPAAQFVASLMPRDADQSLR